MRNDNRFELERADRSAQSRHIPHGINKATRSFRAALLASRMKLVADEQEL